MTKKSYYPLENLGPELLSISIRATRSRIEKGLLAIPGSSTELLPNTRTDIKLWLGRDAAPIDRAYVPASGNTKEARIYGLSEWFKNARVQHGNRVRLCRLQTEPPVYWLAREEEYQTQVVQRIVHVGEDARTE